VRREIASVSPLTVLLTGLQWCLWGKSLDFVGVAFSAQAIELVSKAPRTVHAAARGESGLRGISFRVTGTLARSLYRRTESPENDT
jgi:hypothetical protein